MRNVFVLGSINMDLLISTDRMPLIGESKPAHGFLANQGGKGANQAIAVKKLGCDKVSFIGAVGDDQNGEALRSAIESYGVETSGLKVTKEAASGVCIIVFDESQKDNILLIEGGANQKVETSFVGEFLRKSAKKDDIFITQLETNLDAVEEGLKVAKSLGMYTILNPAPVKPLDKSIYSYVDLIAPNETETKLLVGIDVADEASAIKAAEAFGTPETLITLGSKGGFYVKDGKAIKSPVHKVEAVDTTCAGDTFIGALALRKAEGKTIEESLDFAAKCSSITVSRRGAGISIPTKEEVAKL